MEVNNFGTPVILDGDMVKKDLDNPFEELPGFCIRLLRVPILADWPELWKDKDKQPDNLQFPSGTYQ